jgi:hypothetical protein
MTMKGSNILVVAHQGREKNAMRFLSQHGEFKSSGFKDVLRGHVEDCLANWTKCFGSSKARGEKRLRIM